MNSSQELNPYGTQHLPVHKKINTTLIKIMSVILISQSNWNKGYDINVVPKCAAPSFTVQKQIACDMRQREISGRKG